MRYFIIFVLLVFCFSGCQEGNQNNVESTKNSAQTQANVTKAITPKKTQHLYIGTGSVKGVYFPIGGIICRLLNRHQALHRLRCTLESTGGSVSNLRQLKKGEFDLVVSQSDWQYHAYHGTSVFEKSGANTQLRAVLALESDVLALIVPKYSQITAVDQLLDKRVSFGYSRTLQYRIMQDFLLAKGLKINQFTKLQRMRDIKQIPALCDDKLDAALLMSSSLNSYLKDVGAQCELRFIPLSEEVVEKIIQEKPYYRTGTIFASDYFDVQDDVPSFGLGATFVASASSSPKAIYHVVKEIVENFKDFQLLHPSLRDIKKSELPYAGISAPLHPGAIQYYKEAHLLKKDAK